MCHSFMPGMRNYNAGHTVSNTHSSVPVVTECEQPAHQWLAAETMQDSFVSFILGLCRLRKTSVFLHRLGKKCLFHNMGPLISLVMVKTFVLPWIPCKSN